MADRRNDGPHLLPRPSQRRVVRRVPGIARLREPPAGPMPFRHGKTDLRKLSGPLLSKEQPRAGEDGDALCRAANALGAPRFKHMALDGWNAEGDGLGKLVRIAGLEPENWVFSSLLIIAFHYSGSLLPIRAQHVHFMASRALRVQSLNLITVNEYGGKAYSALSLSNLGCHCF